jgi:phosphoenolpyruvate carboxylase
LSGVEQIRLSSKEAQDSDSWDALDRLLASVEEQEFLIIARAFSQFLNLANIADQHHTTAVHTERSFFSECDLAENTAGAGDQG